MKNEKLLMKQIEHKRDIMNNVASKKGVTSPDSIQTSQELDRLINEFMQNFGHTSGYTGGDEKRNK